MPYNWKSCLNIKPDSSQQTYLNKREIKAIFEYTPRNITERVVQLQFTLGCLTGARKSDYINFTKNNIHKNHLIYCAKKTGTSVTVPVTKATRAILKELDEISQNIDGVDIYDISKMCGHSSIAITERYVCSNVMFKSKIKKHFDNYDEMLCND